MPAVVTVDQPFDAGGLYTLRATLAAHASQLGVPGQQIEALLIVASELATNAIRHGGGTGRLRMWRHRTTLHCQVSDRGPGIADPGVGTTPPDPAGNGGGRGMWICRQLCDELVITSAGQRGDAGTGPGATVTAVINLDDPA